MGPGNEIRVVQCAKGDGKLCGNKHPIDVRVNERARGDRSEEIFQSHLLDNILY